MERPGDVVRRYFALVADLGSTADDLTAVLHPEVRVVEHPNRFTPAGAVRDRDAVIAGFLAGKRLLATQSFDIHELVEDGERVALRATWRGTIAAGSPAMPAGTEIVTHVAAWLTVDGGRVREHETFDCAEPFGPG